MASSSSRGQARAEPAHPQPQPTPETTEAGRTLPTAETFASQRPLPHILDDGITELWCPPDPTHVVADIYFVHGLMGHPFKTWYHRKAPPSQKPKVNSESKTQRLSKIFGRKHEDRRETRGNNAEVPSSKGRGCYWPLDLIPNDFDNLGGNQMNISQHAQNLLQRIRNTRSHCQGRPIIFVAHSLGGILVEDAIIESGKSKHQPGLMDISRSCVAIFFFGTPHHGSDAARYGEFLGKIVELGGISVNKQILRGLERNGEKLSAVERDFNDLLNDDIPPSEKLQLCSFQEGKTLTGLKFFPVGKVVEDSSSHFNRRDIENSMFINENHMEMARFQSAQIQGYINFQSMLTEYLHKIETTTSAQRLREQMQATERAALMKALDFTERCIREQQLSSLDTPEETFTWIWDSPFKTWLENDSSMFWISGKPASGKSTLMNYVRRAGNTQNILSNSHHNTWRIIYFFFDFRAGRGIGNNMEGFLRSVLRQLCEQLPSIIPSITQTVPDLARIVAGLPQRQHAFPHGEHISVANLRTALLQGLRSCSESLMILLDGLDEYEGEQVELCNFIKTLRGDGVKICLASRPDPPFPDAFAGLPSFRMQDLNFNAIRKFGLHVLDQFYSDQQYPLSTFEALADTVARRSLGVFLWARFAIFELIKGLSRGEKLASAALMKRLDEMPRELQDIYSRIFQRASQGEKKTAGLILLLMCFALGEVTSDMLQIAITYLPPSSPLYPDPATILATKGEENEFSKRLLAVTGGTVEVIKARAYVGDYKFLSSVPRLIHRTVETYLERRGWKEILGDIYNSALGHKTWIEICTQTVLEEGPNLARLRAFVKGRGWHFRISRDNTHVDSDGGESDSVSHQKSLANSDESPRSIATSRRSVDVDLRPSSANPSQVHRPTPQTLLLGYAGARVLGHASDYEETSATSSSPLIGALVDSPFIDFHLNVTSCSGSCGAIPRLSEAENFGVELVHLAAGHGLRHYVEEYVRQLQERQTPIVDRILEMVHLKKTQDSAKTLKFLKTVAVFCVIKHYQPPQTMFEMVSSLLEQCPIVEGVEILAAVGYRYPGLLKTLLRYRPGDVTLLKVDLEVLRLYLPTLAWASQGKRLGPLAAFCPQTYVRFQDSFEQEILFMLMDRGVHINAACGPLGGVLHYIVGVSHNLSRLSLHHSKNELQNKIDLLMRYGVDINQLGPQGTPLEFLWTLVNTGGQLGQAGINELRALLGVLIVHGGVNRRKDPNGLVPSVIQMRLFGCNWTDYWECRRFYRDGPRDGGSVWPGPVPLHPDDAVSADEGDMPFDEAIEEYRVAMGLESVANGDVDGNHLEGEEEESTD